MSEAHGRETKFSDDRILNLLLNCDILLVLTTTTFLFYTWLVSKILCFLWQCIYTQKNTNNSSFPKSWMLEYILEL